MKPKTVPEPIVGLQAKAKKTVTLPSLGKGKGLITGSVPVAEKPPIVLREDCKYALEQLSSIITAGDYEDLSNHATEAMRETGLFCIAQVTSSVLFFLFSSLPLALLLTLLPFQAMLTMKGLRGRYLNHEMAIVYGRRQG